MKTKSLKQSLRFNASKHDLFEALMDSRKHAKFTRDKASISRKVGGKFTAYGDYIEGKNLEIEPDSKIVQTWRASDWPEDFYSKVTFAIDEVGGKARLRFWHSGIPEDKFEEVKKGWNEFYWEPLRALLEG